LLKLQESLKKITFKTTDEETIVNEGINTLLANNPPLSETEKKAKEEHQKYLSDATKNTNKENTTEVTNVFDKTEEDFDALFDGIHPYPVNKTVLTKTELDKTALTTTEPTLVEDTQTIDLLKKYWETENISNVYFGNAGNNNGEFASEYKDGTRVIECDISTTIDDKGEEIN
jgi:hypothetical protein